MSKQIMVWTNETTMEFITLLANKPELWNPAKRLNNRSLMTDAWSEVCASLSIPTTIEDLKRKKNNLLTEYKKNLNKIKKSMRSDEVYKPRWYAFDSVNNLFGDLWRFQEHKIVTKTEVEDDQEQEDGTDVPLQGENEIFSVKEEQYLSDSPQNSDDECESTPRKKLCTNSGTQRETIRTSKQISVLRVTKTEVEDDQEQEDGTDVPLQGENEKISVKEEQYLSDSPQNSDDECESTPRKKRRSYSGTQRETIRPSKQISVQSEVDCDLYGKLLASKLKRINEDDRLEVMNEIDNLLLRRVMKARTQTGYPTD